MALSRELLGRAHGALSVSGDSGPCVAVLREILNSIEGVVPAPAASAVVLVSSMGDPTLVYVSSAGAVDLGSMIEAGDLRDWAQRNGSLHLRFTEALLQHGLALVDTARLEDE